MPSRRERSDAQAEEDVMKGGNDLSVGRRGILLGGATLGSGGDQRLYFASIGLDLARLTVHRHSGLDWFANPMRAPED